MSLRLQKTSGQNAGVRYFDHNATHPVSSAARGAWLEAVERFPANPSSPHRWGSRAANALEEARAALAAGLGCEAHDVVWTSGATESNNAVLHHLGLRTGGRVLLSPLEHPSMREAAGRWLTGRCREIPVSRDGVVDVGWVESQVRAGGVAAVVVMAANNETGVIQPWETLRDLCRGAGVAYVCDAAQWVGKLPAAGLGSCDFATGCAHKFGGIPGVGFLKAPGGFLPLLVGGPQEEGRRAGTENVFGVWAMAAAYRDRETFGGLGTKPGSQGETASFPETARRAIRDRFVDALKASLPGVAIVGERSERLWNTVSALMPPSVDCRRRWVVKLDRLGFAVSTGSACASGKEQPSHVLAAMGYRPDESDRMLRFSSGWETTEADWEALLGGIRQAAEALRTGIPIPR